MTGYLYVTGARGKSCADGKSEDELNVAETIEVKKKNPEELVFRRGFSSVSRHFNGCVKFEFNDKQLCVRNNDGHNRWRWVGSAVGIIIYFFCLYTIISIFLFQFSVS